MTTDMTPRGELPTPTPKIASSLSPQELQEHRNRIGAEVRAVLSAYFQPSETDKIRAMQLSWWCDELQDWTQEQVVWALRKWNRENPRLRPTPGDIVGICKAERGRKHAETVKAVAARQVDGDNVSRVSPERAAEILREAGLSPRRFNDGGTDA